jgi:phospholipid N-methyltransferase
MFDSNSGTFFRQWVRNPRESGALSASGQALASEMARLVDHDGRGSVIELGGGTGAITQALLENGIPASQLMVVEKNPSLADALHRRFSEVRIIRQDASRLRQIVRGERNAIIKTIVSGLPMLLLGRRKQYAILRQAFGLMEPGGRFLQFTYGPSTPVCRRVLERLGIKGERASFIWRNAPPATVWQFSRINQTV